MPHFSIKENTEMLVLKSINSNRQNHTPEDNFGLPFGALDFPLVVVLI